MIIALDVMGGDYAPQEIIAGALMWNETSDIELLLVGREEEIARELQGKTYQQDKLHIINASQVMEMDEPVTALRKKQDSSIVVSTRLVRENRAHAVVSCGSTAAQMAAATLVLGRLEGIDRPPIVTAMPPMAGQVTLLLDAGANVDCKPHQLVQFAQLGRVYASILTGVENPRVGLLSNGEEAGKGNALTYETYQLLQSHTDLNFIGNVEGSELFAGKSDVLVCDGFIGNLLLKSLEGMAMMIAKVCMQEMGRVPSIFNYFDKSRIGGAPLLGINGVSIVCHGSSKREAVFNGIRTAAQCVTNDIVNKQKAALVPGP